MTEISRRSVTRGAAWSVPVIATAAAAPGFAASVGEGDFRVACNTAVITTRGTSSYTHVLATGGTRHSWDFGFIDVEQAPTGSGANNFIMSDHAVRTITQSGATHVGTLESGAITTWQGIPYGVSQSITFRTSMPYSATCLEANEHVVRMELDFCITYRRMFESVQQTSQKCCYTLVNEWAPNQAGVTCPTKYRAASGTLVRKFLKAQGAPDPA